MLLNRNNKINIDKYQTKYDNNLNTIDKTIVGSINEIRKENIVYVSDFKNLFNNDWSMLKYLMDNYSHICIDVDITLDITESYNLKKSLFITGNKKITINSDLKNLICISSDNLTISFKNISLNLNFNGRLITGNDDGYLNNNVELIEVDNCDITGKGILCLLYIHQDDEKIIKVKKSIFENNYIHDLKMEFQILPLSSTNNYQCYGLFLVENVSIDYISLKNNRIKNTERTIGQFKDRNSNNFRNLIEVSNNNYINDDDCWGRNDEHDAMYYVFVMLEADTCIYNNNYVEGLKIKSFTITPGKRTVGCETYDVYNLSREYIATNNTTVNCMPFYSNTIVNSANSSIEPTIFKSKNSENVTLENNKFIVTQDFINKFNDIENLNKTFVFYDNTAEEDTKHNNLIIKNNLIKVPYIRFETDRTNFSGIYNFENNTIRTDSISGYIFYNGPEQHGDRIFKGNNIVSSTDTGASFKILHHAGNPSLKEAKLIIENNNILVPNFYKSEEENRVRYSIDSQYSDIICVNNIFENPVHFQKTLGNSIFSNNISRNCSGNVVFPNRYFNNSRISEVFYYNNVTNPTVILGQPMLETNCIINSNVIFTKNTGEEVPLFVQIKFENGYLTFQNETLELTNLNKVYRFGDLFVQIRLSSSNVITIGVHSSVTDSNYVKTQIEMSSYDL